MEDKKQNRAEIVRRRTLKSKARRFFREFATTEDVEELKKAFQEKPKNLEKDRNN